ncbi:receptor-transporting protein 3-like [Eleutherodactylus coqui]|uniref:receptor-transporting protein 3-like n=1 Tax=Eleutherodactylus coqui TaxID=57060 RepID=UPI0034618F51
MDAKSWKDEFYNEIEERGVRGHWELYGDDNLNTQERGAQYTQRTFGRFQCSGCKRWWNSAEVHVLFFMTLNKPLRQGTVKMRIFRQECKRCSFPKLEKPEISHENIIRITKNLVNRILQVFYGEMKLKQNLKPEVYSKDMEGPHDKEHCEACKLQICKWSMVTTKQQLTVKGSFAQKNAVYTPKTPTKAEQSWTAGKTSPSVFPTTTNYQGPESNLRSTLVYPKYPTERCAPASPPNDREDSTLTTIYAITAGIGALALWYFQR